MYIFENINEFSADESHIYDIDYVIHDVTITANLYDITEITPKFSHFFHEK